MADGRLVDVRMDVGTLTLVLWLDDRGLEDLGLAIRGLVDRGLAVRGLVGRVVTTAGRSVGVTSFVYDATHAKIRALVWCPTSDRGEWK